MSILRVVGLVEVMVEKREGERDEREEKTEWRVRERERVARFLKNMCGYAGGREREERAQGRVDQGRCVCSCWYSLGVGG